MKELFIDIESYSDIDLTKSGVYKYVESDNFSILLFAYSIDGGEVHQIDVANGEQIPREILFALSNKDIKKFSYNAQFERVCMSKYLT